MSTSVLLGKVGGVGGGGLCLCPNCLCYHYTTAACSSGVFVLLRGFYYLRGKCGCYSLKWVWCELCELSIPHVKCKLLKIKPYPFPIVDPCIVLPSVSHPFSFSIYFANLFTKLMMSMNSIILIILTTNFLKSDHINWETQAMITYIPYDKILPQH